MPENANKRIFVPFRDFIPRYSTSSVMVVQGVKEKESPALTTMWTILGSPLTAVAVPVWLNKENIYPSVLLADETGNARLCDWSLQLKKQLFPITRGEGTDYINLAALISADGNGIMQKVQSHENRILNDADALLSKWRTNGYDPKDLKYFCHQTDIYVSDLYFMTFAIRK